MIEISSRILFMTYLKFRYRLTLNNNHINQCKITLIFECNFSTFNFTILMWLFSTFWNNQILISIYKIDPPPIKFFFFFFCISCTCWGSRTLAHVEAFRPLLEWIIAVRMFVCFEGYDHGTFCAIIWVSVFGFLGVCDFWRVIDRSE